MEEIRINKYIATNFGISRREADMMVEQGKVCINGKPAEIGARVKPGDKVELSGKELATQKMTYILFHKPVGYVCSRKKQGEAPTLYDLLPPELRELKTVGRLDKNSSGILLLTNDGDFTFQMTHPKFAKTKIYIVEIDHDLAPLHQQMITDYGINLNDGISKLGLTRLNEDNRRQWQVEMSEGRNRQIRRTFDALGYKVISLHRTNFGPYAIGNLKPGEWQEIEIKK